MLKNKFVCTKQKRKFHVCGWLSAGLGLIKEKYNAIFLFGLNILHGFLATAAEFQRFCIFFAFVEAEKFHPSIDFLFLSLSAPLKLNMHVGRMNWMSMKKK